MLKAQAESWKASHQNMKILCIGENGQVARSLIQTASSMDINLNARGRAQLDLLDRDSIVRSVTEVSPSIIINAGAYTAVDKAESDVDAAMDLNARAPRHLAEIAEDHSIPLIHYSTDYVFDGEHTEPYDEDHEVSPSSVYGRSKLLGENAIAESTSRFIILRTAWVYGPYGNNFVKTMLRLAQDRAEVSVVCDQLGNPTSSLDIARATLKICQKLNETEGSHVWGRFHMVGSGTASWAEFAQEIFDISSTLNGPTASVRSITSEEYPSPVKRPMNSRLNCSKLEETYGVSLPEWKTSLAETIDLLVSAKR
ncbi:MAG: dTDP-4-dehydrorhamnose reductase [Pseudomonadota bacterium]